MTIESERTFIINEESDIRSLLDVVWPQEDFLNVDGSGLLLEKWDLSRSVHLYSVSSNDHRRRRAKFRLSGSRIRASLEAKEWRDGVKHETALMVASSPNAIVFMLNEFGAILSCFAKERLLLSYSYRGKREEGIKTPRHRLKVGLDVVVPFCPKALTARAPVFYIEFEGSGHGEEKFFCDSNLFHTYIRKWVRPCRMSQAKWRVSRLSQAWPDAFSWDWELAQRLVSQVNTVLEAPAKAIAATTCPPERILGDS